MESMVSILLLNANLSKILNENLNGKGDLPFKKEGEFAISIWDFIFYFKKKKK